MRPPPDELLDEVLDYGYPQNCSTDVLKLYITQQGDKSAADKRDANQAVTIQATGAISWRKEGIKCAMPHRPCSRPIAMHQPRGMPPDGGVNVNERAVAVDGCCTAKAS